MKQAQPLNPSPKSITVRFNRAVTLWECNVSSYGNPVKSIKIENPFLVQYHTYGHGIVTYFVTWFSESVRPLRKYEITFDTSDIKSIQIDN